MKFIGVLAKKRGSEKNTRSEVFARRCTELTEHLAEVRSNFNYVTDPPAIDALIFEENATLCRLEQLYREAKAEGISVEVYERGRRF